MLHRIAVVLRKELADALRDRRTMFSLLGSALLGPIMLFILLSVIGGTTNDQIERPLDLPVAGAERAPGLMAFLQQHNVVVKPAPPDPEAAVRDGAADVVLVVGEGYAERLAAGLPAPLRLVNDSTRQSASNTVTRARRLLEGYGAQLGAMRLQARGVSPSVVQPLVVEDVDLATPETRAAQMLNMLPYFIVFAIFIGGMSLIVDMTAGERERGSLEPLLINPLSRAEFVLGKLLASLAPTFLSVVIALAGFAAVANLTSLGEQIGVRLSLGLPALAGILLITVPMMVLAAALQMVIATLSRTVKEAQSYLAFLPLVPALPGIFLAFLPLRPALWMMLVPTFGQQLLINQLMRGEAIDPLFAAVSALTTLAIGAAFTLAAVRLFGREAVLFGKGA